MGLILTPTLLPDLITSPIPDGTRPTMYPNPASGGSSQSVSLDAEPLPSLSPSPQAGVCSFLTPPPGEFVSVILEPGYTLLSLRSLPSLHPHDCLFLTSHDLKGVQFVP